MTFETKLIRYGLALDDGKVRLVVDTANQECRIFEHYTNNEGKPKLALKKTLTFEKLLKTLAKKGETK